MIDLADVSFADAAGIELLKHLQGRDVDLLSLAPFLAFQLQEPENRK
jgi:hypothetical protein